MLVSLELVFVFGLLLVCVLLGPLLLQAVIRKRCTGKMYCGVVQKGKPLTFKMKKIVDGEFIQEGEDKWFIRENQVKLVDYPTGWSDRFLGMFKQVVPCSLYMPGRAEPLDWEDPSSGSLSSKELAAILDPYWLKALVSGVAVEGGVKAGKRDKILLFLAVGLGAINMVLLFFLLAF